MSIEWHIFYSFIISLLASTSINFFIWEGYLYVQRTLCHFWSFNSPIVCLTLLIHLFRLLVYDEPLAASCSHEAVLSMSLLSRNQLQYSFSFQKAICWTSYFIVNMCYITSVSNYLLSLYCYYYYDLCCIFATITHLAKWKCDFYILASWPFATLMLLCLCCQSSYLRSTVIVA